MQAAVIRDREDKWGNEPIVFVADTKGALEEKVADFLRQCLSDKELALIVGAGERDTPYGQPTKEEIADFRKHAAASDLVEGYDEHVVPDVSPHECWHISYAEAK